MSLSGSLHNRSQRSPVIKFQNTRVRNICGFLYFLDLFNRLQIRGQSTMHAENSIINECCDRQTVEAVNEGFPEFDIVSSFAFSLKNVYIRHKIHKFYWLRSTRGFLSGEKSFWGTWSCRPEEDKWFRVSICLCQRNRRERGNCFRVGICHDRRAWVNRGTGHECRLG